MTYSLSEFSFSSCRHHGNGTEAIVRNLKPHHETLPLPASWGTQTFYSYKPWLNELDVSRVDLLDGG